MIIDYALWQECIMPLGLFGAFMAIGWFMFYYEPAGSDAKGSLPPDGL